MGKRLSIFIVVAVLSVTMILVFNFWENILEFSHNYLGWLLVLTVAFVLVCFFGPRIPAISRWLGPKVSASAACLAALFAIVGFVYVPVTFFLLPSEPSALLGQSLHLESYVRQKDQTESRVQGYHCHYSFNPRLPIAAWQQGPACELTITDLPAIFTAHRTSPLTITITADPFQWWARWQGPAPVSVVLYDIAAPRVQIQQAIYGLGSHVPVSVSFGDGPAPPAYSCVWSPLEYFAPASRCATTFKVPTSGSALASKTVEISARVISGGEQFSTDNLKLSIAAPPPNLFQVVLDLSGRMGVLLPNGRTFFDVARDALIDDIERFAVQGGWLDIIGFGDKVAPNAKSCDERVASIYRLAAVDAAAARTKLDALTFGGPDAPLAHAIDRAVEEYQEERPRYADPNLSPESTYIFAIITAGTNECDSRSLAHAIHMMTAAFDKHHLESQSRSGLSFIVAKDSPVARLTYHDASYQEYRTILLLVQNRRELQKIVGAITDLFNKRSIIRRAACATLDNALFFAGDKNHQAVLRQSNPCST